MSHEQNLLQETASREAELTKRLGDVEQDLKVKLQELNHVKIENSKIHSRHVELTSSFEKMESEKKILKDELRDIKFRESRMMRDYSELEEENTTMQKHVSGPNPYPDCMTHKDGGKEGMCEQLVKRMDLKLFRQNLPVLKVIYIFRNCIRQCIFHF